MRIAFDGKKAAGNRAGLGNYSRFVISSLARRYPDCQFDVYVSKRRGNGLLDRIEKLPNVNICYPKHPVLKYFPKLWERYGIPHEVAERGADIFHGLGNDLPAGIRKAGRTKAIVTIHDLIFLFFPHTYSWINRHLFNLKFRSSCRKADRIIAVSQCTAKDIVKYYFIPKQKISVAYQGCDPRFREKCTEEKKEDVRRRFSLPERFILNVGTIEERKNAELIVRALQELPELSLVIVGKRTPYADRVEAAAVECGVVGRVKILSGVATEDLPAFYQMAEVFVYPSRYEGFGIPVLEALCSGVPAIGATGSCLEEAGGPGSLYVGPDDTAAMVDAIDTACNDEARRQAMIARGRAHAARFSDRLLADSLMAAYRKAVGEQGLRAKES